MFIFSVQKFCSSVLRAVILCAAILCTMTAFTAATSHSLYDKVLSSTLDNLDRASTQPQFMQESPVFHDATDELQHELDLVDHVGGHINVMAINEQLQPRAATLVNLENLWNNNSK